MDPKAVKRVFEDLYNLIIEDENNDILNDFIEENVKAIPLDNSYNFELNKIIETEIYNNIIGIIGNNNLQIDYLHEYIRSDLKHYKGERSSKIVLNLNSEIIHPNYKNYGDPLNLHMCCCSLDDYYKKLIKKQKKSKKINKIIQ